MNPNQASLLGTGINVAGQALAGPTGGLSLVASSLIGGFMNELAQPEIKKVVKKDVNRVDPFAGKLTGQHGGNAQESQVIEKQVGASEPSAALGVLNQVSGMPGLAQKFGLAQTSKGDTQISKGDTQTSKGDTGNAFLEGMKKQQWYKEIKKAQPYKYLNEGGYY
jgi:hypothetical protein